MTTMPTTTLIALATLCLGLVLVFVKIIKSNSILTQTSDQLRNDYKEVITKLDIIRECVHKIEIEMKGVTTELKFKDKE